MRRTTWLGAGEALVLVASGGLGARGGEQRAFSVGVTFAAAPLLCTGL